MSTTATQIAKAEELAADLIASSYDDACYVAPDQITLDAIYDWAHAADLADYDDPEIIAAIRLLIAAA